MFQVPKVSVTGGIFYLAEQRKHNKEIELPTSIMVDKRPYRKVMCERKKERDYLTHFHVDFVSSHDAQARHRQG